MLNGIFIVSLFPAEHRSFYCLGWTCAYSYLASSSRSCRRAHARAHRKHRICTFREQLWCCTMHGCLLISICNLNQGGFIEGPSSYLQGSGGAQGSVHALQSGCASMSIGSWGKPITKAEGRAGRAGQGRIFCGNAVECIFSQDDVVDLQHHMHTGARISVILQYNPWAEVTMRQGPGKR